VLTELSAVNEGRSNQTRRIHLQALMWFTHAAVLPLGLVFSTRLLTAFTAVNARAGASARMFANPLAQRFRALIVPRLQIVL